MRRSCLTPYCPRAERIALYMAAERRAYEETGRRTLYCVNITGTSAGLLNRALGAIEMGANALLVNTFQVGLDVVAALTRDARINVPILGHSSGSTALYAGETTGIALPLVVGKLQRLAGVDLGIVLSSFGPFPNPPDRVAQVVREMRGAAHQMKPVLPVIAAGITSEKVPDTIAQFGMDIALGAGTPIFNDLDGITAGAAQLRQAIERVTAG